MVTATQKWSRAYRSDVARLGLARHLTSSRSKVFMAIDVEWDETDPSNILEIGIAVLDLRQGRLHPNRFPPSTWSIRPRHLIITDHREIHNSKYVQSNKFGFKFGRSYNTREARAVQVMQSMLDRYANDEIVLVGHLCRNDLSRLDELGIQLPEGIQVFDTADLERAFMGRVNGQKVSLQRMCEELEVAYYGQDKLHNAGNDAFFTMASFAEMCCVSGQH